MKTVAEAEEQIRGELERMQPVIEEITGGRSRWNGRVEQEFAFYRNLLYTPIRRRPTYVFELKKNLGNEQRREFVSAFALAHAVLRE